MPLPSLNNVPLSSLPHLALVFILISSPLPSPPASLRPNCCKPCHFSWRASPFQRCIFVVACLFLQLASSSGLLPIASLIRRPPAVARTSCTMVLPMAVPIVPAAAGASPNVAPVKPEISDKLVVFGGVAGIAALPRTPWYSIAVVLSESGQQVQSAAGGPWLVASPGAPVAAGRVVPHIACRSSVVFAVRTLYTAACISREVLAGLEEAAAEPPIMIVAGVDFRRRIGGIDSIRVAAVLASGTMGPAVAREVAEVARRFAVELLFVVGTSGRGDFRTQVEGEIYDALLQARSQPVLNSSGEYHTLFFLEPAAAGFNFAPLGKPSKVKEWSEECALAVWFGDVVGRRSAAAVQTRQQMRRNRRTNAPAVSKRGKQH